jgi:hypothetical protein
MHSVQKRKGDGPSTISAPFPLKSRGEVEIALFDYLDTLGISSFES